MFFKDRLTNTIISAQQGFANSMSEFILRRHAFSSIVDVSLDWLVESNSLFNRTPDIDALTSEDSTMETDGFDFSSQIMRNSTNCLIPSCVDES